MRVLVQWSTSRPGDWEEVDSKDFHLLPSRPVPTGTERLDGERGWITALNVQGVTFEGCDHYAVEDLPNGACRVYAWRDDQEDATLPLGHVWTFYPLSQDPDSGGGWNTRQFSDVYLPDESRSRWPTERQRTTFRPLHKFEPPPGPISRHGIWMPDGLNEAHLLAQTKRGWREWTEGLPSEQVRDGKLIPQRPQGLYKRHIATQTFYQGNNAQAVGLWAASNELAYESSAQSSSNTESIKKSGSELSHSWVTAAGVPGVGSWPTGDYRVQLDVATANAALSYGFLSGVGSHNGNLLARLPSTLDSWVDAQVQQESAFSGTGTKLATTGSMTPSGSDSTDRFGSTLAAANSDTKNNYDLSLTFDSDAWADGPWSAPPLNISLTGYGIDEAAAVGTPADVAPGAVTIDLFALGINLRSLGYGEPTVVLDQSIDLTGQGIDEAAAVGAPLDVVPGAVTVDLTGDGIDSSPLLGTPTVAPGGVTIDLFALGINLRSIGYGQPDVVPGVATVDLTGEGIDASASHGQPTVTTGPVTIDLTGEGISDGQDFGSPTVVLAGGSPQDIDLTGEGIASSTAIGTPAVAPGPVTIDLTGEGVVSTLAVGQPTVTPGEVLVDLTGEGISAPAAIGQPDVLVGEVLIVLTGYGIASTLALGTPVVPIPGVGTATSYAADGSGACTETASDGSGSSTTTVVDGSGSCVKTGVDGSGSATTTATDGSGSCTATASG